MPRHSASLSHAQGNLPAACCLWDKAGCSPALQDDPHPTLTVPFPRELHMQVLAGPTIIFSVRPVLQKGALRPSDEPSPSERGPGASAVRSISAAKPELFQPRQRMQRRERETHKCAPGTASHRQSHASGPASPSVSYVLGLVPCIQWTLTSARRCDLSGDPRSSPGLARGKPPRRPEPDLPGRGGCRERALRYRTRSRGWGWGWRAPRD